jgi:prevent-host-death family protein
MEISAAQFKAKCLKLMDDIARTRKSIIITKRGKPVAKLMPVEPESRQPLFGYMAGTIAHMADVESPLAVHWEAEAETEPHLYPSSRRTRRGK